MNISDKIEFGYAQIGAVNLHYAKAGKGEKLVILLHGFPEFWYSWRHQLAALSDEYTVIAPDMRGYNLSDKPPRVEDYAIEKLVDDVTGLIRYFERTEAAIVGPEWGASVAWAIAQLVYVLSADSASSRMADETQQLCAAGKCTENFDR
jgi:pimeloyl-ACP methyl ester carboxylesterase